ncbi:MAG TPA: cyclic nucleotide-binding domain-containing protein [Candidatus Binatia bacterium]|nr:cyclic nucleotide-binding domain-containing protein [Candidatus Binatia bacterium]
MGNGIEEHRAALRAIPLFAALPDDQLALLAEVAATVDVAPGRTIARQGEVGSGLFVILEGRVRVVRDGETVTRLGRGEFFGELSVLDRLPRVASVVAEEPTRCLAIAAWDAEQLLLAHPAVTLALLRTLAGRLRQTTTDHHH